MRYLALIAFVFTMFGAMAVPTTQAMAYPRCGWHHYWVPGHWVWYRHYRRWIPGHCA